MYNTPQVKGAGVHWGVSTTGITGYGSLVTQTTNQTLEASQELAARGDGYTMTSVHYDHRESATLETWISGSANSSAVGIAVANVPQPGDLITITDSTNTILSGSNWIAGNATINRGNTTYAKISVPLQRFALITS